MDNRPAVEKNDLGIHIKPTEGIRSLVILAASRTLANDGAESGHNHYGIEEKRGTVGGKGARSFKKKFLEKWRAGDRNFKSDAVF